MMRASRARPVTLGKPPFSPVKEMSPRSNPSSPAFAGGKTFSPVSLGSGSPPLEAEDRWEVRPGGMLVQRRDPDAADTPVKPPPASIRVRVKYEGAYHEVFINPEASFGELKKLLSVQTGLHPQDQKVLYKDKERESSAFLDMSGVKDKSKLVVVEDQNAKAKRLLEMRKNAKMEKAAKAVIAITAEVDRLAKQVSLVESIVGKGKKVAENDVVGLIEQLMVWLVKLDDIAADGDDNIKKKKETQIVRVRKYVEALDMVKMKNSQPVSNSSSPRTPLPPPQQRKMEHHHQPLPQLSVSRNPYIDQLSDPCPNHQHHQQQGHQLQRSPHSSQVDLLSSPTWEPYDLLSSAPSSSSTTTPRAATPATAVGAPLASPVLPVPIARFEWELF